MQSPPVAWVCSNDLTQGVRSTARAIVSAEQGVRQGVDLAGKAVSGYVVPKIRGAVPEARGKEGGGGVEGTAAGTRYIVL